MIPIKAWPQDKIRRPVASLNSGENPYLAGRIDREHFVYAMDFPISNAGAVISQTFVIPQSNDFFLTNICVVCFATATQQSLTAAGMLSVNDNSNVSAPFIENLWLRLVQRRPQANSPEGSMARRTIWPRPYGIGAGGSFTATIVLEPSVSYSDGRQMITFEGFKDYTMGIITDG